jgi:uncharacterized protein (DUF2062 family)
MGRYLRHVPRLKQLRGSWLHRTLGDRLLRPELWHLDREGVARGLAIGAFFSMIPIPLQSLPAAVLALLTRANLPAALIGCWITNPVTGALILYLQIRIGCWLMGKPSPLAHFHDESWLQLLKSVPGPLTLGAVVLGTALATVTYFAAGIAYDLVVNAFHRARRKAGRTREGN